MSALCHKRTDRQFGKSGRLKPGGELSPEAQALFKNVGFEGFSSTPDELGDFIKAQLALWGKMIKDASIQLD